MFNVDKLEFALVEGKMYLCEIVENTEKGGVDLTHALHIPDGSSKQHGFITWMCLRNLDMLNTVHMTKESGYAQSPLDVDDVQTLGRMVSDLTRIKRTVVVMIENDYLQTEWNSSRGHGDPALPASGAKRPARRRLSE